MKFTKTNELNGTSLQGYITIGYDQLADKLGEPHGNDSYKVDAEWGIKFEDGTIATIYNYKDGKNYLGEDGESVEDILDWHIGGHNFKAVECINKLFS